MRDFLYLVFRVFCFFMFAQGLIEHTHRFAESIHLNEELDRSRVMSFNFLEGYVNLR